VQHKTEKEKKKVMHTITVFGDDIVACWEDKIMPGVGP